MSNENMIENESQQPEEGENNIPAEKTFTQSQLEEIIRERLSRERKTNEALSSVKTLLKSVSEKGLIKGSSYSEMAKELIGRLQASLETREESCDEQSLKDTTPVCADADGKINDGVDTGNDGKDEKCASTGDFFGILTSIKSKYPQTAVEKLLSGDLFERFAKGRSGSVEEIFDDYYSFVTAANPDVQTSSEDSESGFSSTAFSSQSGAVNYGSNLTKQQMDIAKSAGMSYREYQNLLESIPKSRTRTF